MKSNIESHNKKFEEIKDLFDMKIKYDASLITCIETEIYPHIEDKINIKLTKQMDQRVTKMRNDMVSNREFEFTKEETKNALTELKEYQ